jgi:hypothetical protein
VVSIPACHAGDPGSIPGLGVSFCIFLGVRTRHHLGNKKCGDQEARVLRTHIKKDASEQNAEGSTGT